MTRSPKFQKYLASPHLASPPFNIKLTLPSSSMAQPNAQRDVKGSNSHRKPLHRLRFNNGAEIRQAVKGSEPRLLVEGMLDWFIISRPGHLTYSKHIVLTSLRNQLTTHPDEDPITSNDARLNLIREWLESAPECEDMFFFLRNDSQVRLTSDVTPNLKLRLFNILRLQSSHLLSRS